MNYLSTIERYHDYRGAIREMLASILTGIGHSSLFENEQALIKALCDVHQHYPFIDLIYTLDASGVQVSHNIGCGGLSTDTAKKDLGKDRSQRPYYQLARDADEVVVTEPYLSTASSKLCVSAALKYRKSGRKVLGYIVIDIDLAEIIEFLMGDTTRRKFQPVFRATYVAMVGALFSVVVVMLFFAYSEIVNLFSFAAHGGTEHQLKPLSIIVFVTLSLAIFDLGKTILEEEVLMHKDIFRHSSTRRTITRFIAAILIAVSIESLIMMFKSALGQSEYVWPAVAMMATAIGLIVSLGLYVYLGSRAEAVLLSTRKETNRS
jgi:hypothetical protein